MLVYTAGPYNEFEFDGVKHTVADNIQAARDVAISLWEEGYAVICPHLNTAWFDELCSASREDYIKGDLRIIATCDAIVMLPDWVHSKGAQEERQFAIYNGLDVYYWPDRPVKPRTEFTSPVQCREFLGAIMRMYRTHLAKNADYSPANILGTGEVGLATRLWDKTSRLLNLLGFKIVIESSSYDRPLEPKLESIEDTYMDLAVYAVIGTLLRKGAWGK